MCDYRIYDNYEEEGESVCFDEKRNKIYRLGRIYRDRFKFCVNVKN